MFTIQFTLFKNIFKFFEFEEVNNNYLKINIFQTK